VFVYIHIHIHTHTYTHTIPSVSMPGSCITSKVKKHIMNTLGAK
jgi:hypothetical protein